MQTIEFHGKTEEALEKLHPNKLFEIRRQSYMRSTTGQQEVDQPFNRAQRILQTQVIAVLASKGH